MKKTNFIFNTTILFCLLILSSGCTKINDNTATISANLDSKYANTFEELNLGIIYDFDFRLPNADKSWVTIWIESYKDGKMEPNPITELSYGLSPIQITEGNVGFGIINYDTKGPLFFLYAPGVSIQPHIVEIVNFSDGFSAWDYAIGDEKVELKLGETNLLGVYRQSPNNSIRTYDLQKEEQVEQMISEDDRVFLLKIKIEESNE